MFTTIILALSAGSAFLLSFISFVNSGKANRAANRWLSLFLFGMGSTFLANVIHNLALGAYYLLLIVFAEIVMFTMAPALYLSISYFTSTDRALKKRDLLHFIPFLLFGINCIPVLISGHDGVLLLNRLGISFPVIAPYLGVFMFLIIKIQVIVYWIYSYVTLTRHQRNIQLIYSSSHTVDLWWLRYFLLGLLFIVLLWFNSTFFHIGWIDRYSPLGYLVSVYFISYFALRQGEIYPFSSNTVMAIEEIIQETSRAAKKQERLTANEVESLKPALIQAMEGEKCFLDPDLGLPQLAEKMKLSPHELSYLLNNGFGITFFEFVNRYRVEEAKMLLVKDDHRHLSMVGIAYGAGFNSKTTFNTTFKKITGMSPTQYKRTVMQTSNPLQQTTSAT